MIKIMFVCHGNICRSPMAEFVFKDMIKKRGIESSFLVSSSATSTEALGNPVHFGTRNKLSKYGISTDGKYSVQLKKSDYDKYDYIIGMDNRNIKNMYPILGEDSGHKIYKLLEFSKQKGDIADPWYTGDFDVAYDNISDGCKNLLKYILNNNTKRL